MSRPRTRALTVESAGVAPRTIERELRSPATGEVVVEVLACALDALDARIAAGRVPTAAPLFPLVPGRHASGVVVEVGIGAEHLRNAKVVVPSLLPCDECEACRRARATLCRRRIALGAGPIGGLQTHMTVPARHLLALPAISQPARRA